MPAPHLHHYFHFRSLLFCHCALIVRVKSRKKQVKKPEYLLLERKRKKGEVFVFLKEGGRSKKVFSFCFSIVAYLCYGLPIFANRVIYVSISRVRTLTAISVCKLHNGACDMRLCGRYVAKAECLVMLDHE
jgi:hypothetical protein